MFHPSRRLKVFSVFFLLVAGGYFVGRLGFSSDRIPHEFVEARMRGALVSQDIVNLSNELASDLEKVNALDQHAEYAKALDETTKLLYKSQEIRGKAVELSQELERMTAALYAIKSTDARGAALESISNRLALISRLINYSDYLAKLSEALERRFAGSVRVGQEIAMLIDQVNAEVTAINNFNRQATLAMERFDAIVSR